MANGFIMAIGIKTGVEPSQEGIAQLVLETMCATDLAKGNVICGQLLLWGVIFFLIGVATFFEDINVNGPLYVMGLVCGFLLIILSK